MAVVARVAGARVAVVACVAGARVILYRQSVYVVVCVGGCLPVCGVFLS